MKSRRILIAIVILATMRHIATAQAKERNTLVEAPPLERVLSGTNTQYNGVVSDLIAFKPEVPLGPLDLLKSYEIAMSLLVEKTSTDFSIIVQTQQANQISREEAEYLLQQRYQVAMMQYQVVSALHDVLKHDIDEATQQAKRSLKTTSSDTVLMVPFPGSTSASR